MTGPFARLSLLAALAAAPLTGCEDRADNEARLLVDRIRAVDAEAPAADRRAHLEQLRGVALAEPRFVAIRDGCVRGHEALLLAEDEQERARVLLGALTQNGGGPADARAPTISAALDASNAAVERAGPLLTQCQSDVAALDAEVGRRR